MRSSFIAAIVDFVFNVATFLFKVRWAVLVAAIFYGWYFVASEQKRLMNLQHGLETRIEVESREVAAPTAVVEKVITTRQPWSNMQTNVKNAVAQVFSQVAQVDILEPYRAPGQSQSTGTAFFISQDGELITNAHVIEQAKAAWIQVPGLGKRQLDIDIIGICFDRDLALIKLRPEALAMVKRELGQITTLELGDSDKVHRAEEIMAIGYPLGQQGLKSTVGVVSGREQHLIQIDAAINPGNSGGPSINIEGQVIGINTMYIAGAQNVGYIIPVNELKLIIDELRTTPLVRKPFLGILYNNGSDSLTQLLGNPEPGGAYVVDVYKDSPLHRAGVQKGDMIYKINGHPVDIYGEIPFQGEKISLIDYVSQLKFGQKITVVVYRQGVRKDIVFVLDASKMLPIRKIYPGYEKIDYEIVAGILVQPLTLNHLPILVNMAPGLTRYAEMKHQAEPALIITHIFPDSIAQRSRTLLPGAIVAEINGVKVKTLDDFRTALQKSAETGYLTLETGDHVFIASTVDKVAQEVQRHAATYFFPISPAVKQLIDAVSKK